MRLFSIGALAAVLVLAFGLPGLAGEAWVQEALETVEQAAEDGRLTLVKNYPTKLSDPLPFEPVGEPSRFLTCQRLRVKRKFCIDR